MLTPEQNRTLTQVGAGTPMGELLRRYWHPIAGASEFDREPIKAVRLMGEDLTLYKDLNGTFGLVDRHCAHRRADLSYGFVEGPGIRCNYHGWRFNEAGQCIEQPYEDTAHPNTRLKERCNIKAYPVKELAGLIWAYMGPLPAPELPVWEAFTREDGFREIALSDIPCNWVQCQENSCDPVHFEWMHDNWSLRQKGQMGPYSARHLKVLFEEFEYGYVYKRIREGVDESDPYWTVGRVALWPNGFFLGDHFEWRVPVDDENTLSVTWFFMHVPKEQVPFRQGSIPTWYAPIKEPNGRWISSHVINQDIIAWVGQGAIADRSKENLGASDRGIALIRNRFFQEIEVVKAGRDPKGVIRNPNVAAYVELPNMNMKASREGISIKDFPKYPLLNARLQAFRHLAGQPPEVRRAFEEAMGIAQ